VYLLEKCHHSSDRKNKVKLKKTKSEEATTPGDE